MLSGPSVQPYNQQRIKQLNEIADIHIDTTELCVRNKLFFTAYNNQAHHMHGITFPSAESEGFCHGGKTSAVFSYSSILAFIYWPDQI